MSGEKYYQNVFYFIFLLIGLRINAEVHTNIGRIDAVIEYQDEVFVFEFKLDKSAEEALEQIKSHHYVEKYQHQNKTLYLIGVNFDSAQRTVENWMLEEIKT